MEELAKAVALRVEHGFPVVVAHKVIVETLNEIMAQLAEGNSVGFKGFGKFSPYKTKSKNCALKHQPPVLPSRASIRFVPGDTFSQKVRDSHAI